MPRWFLLFVGFWIAWPSLAQKPEWYGSGRGPADYYLLLQEIGKPHPFAGGGALFENAYNRHRYRRARIQLNPEPERTSVRERRSYLVRCGLNILDYVRSCLPPGPRIVVPDMVSQDHPDMLTHSYRVDPALAFPNPEMMATLFHGVGAINLSHAGVTAPLVRTLSHPKDRKYKEIAKLLRAQGIEPVRFVAETFDFPMSGNFYGEFEFDSVTREKWGTPSAVGETVGKYLGGRKNWNIALPSVGFGFSAGAAIAGMPELNYLMDALVLVGPVIPGVKAGYVETRNQLFKLAGSLFVPNWEAFYWADTVISQMNWGDLKVPFPKPTLILIGEFDTDVPEQTIQWLEEQARLHSHVHFHRIPGAEHNVLKGYTLRDKDGNKIRDYDPTEAFAIVHRFLRNYGLKK